MGLVQGQFGRTRVFEDFLVGKGAISDMSSGIAWAANSTMALGGVWFNSANEGTFVYTVDEPGGIIAITSDTGDNDNVVLFGGRFVPADGGCVMEARFKVDIVSSCAMFAGFSETMDLSGAPVLPASISTITASANGSGGVAGAVHDADATTAYWHAIAGDGGVVASDMAVSGTGATTTAPVADEWQIARVEMDVNGDAKIYVNDKLVDDIASCVTATDQQYACLMLQNRAAAAHKLEVDYFYAEGNRDWNIT